MTKDLFQAMSQSIIDGERDEAVRLAALALEQDIDPLDAITSGYLPGVNSVGSAFACGDAFLPELVMAGEAMKAAMAVLEPVMKTNDTQLNIEGKVIIGTVEGDIHEIGKSLVGTMLMSSGFEVYDLGVNVPVADFIAKAEETGASLVGVSALLTTTMAKQKDLIDEVKKKNLPIKVMVGGAPVTREWVDKIGADGYAEDAFGAVEVARELIGKK